MNAPTLTRHLLLKDLRHQGGWLAAVWGFALLLPLLALSHNGNLETMGDLDDETKSAYYGFFSLIFLVIARTVRLDAPGRELHFLATRPAPWQALLVSKILFITLFLMIPVWLAKLGIIFLLKIPVSFADVALILAENAIRIGALFTAVALFSIFLRGIPRIFLSMLLAYVVITYGYNIARHLLNHGDALSATQNATLSGSRDLTFLAGIILTVFAVAIFRYRGKALPKPLGILIAGLALSLLAWKYWPYDYSRLFADDSQNMGAVIPPLRDRIKFTQAGGPGLQDNAEWVKPRRSFVYQGVSLEGVEPPFYAGLIDYHAEATLKSGRTIRASYKEIVRQYTVGGPNQQILRQMAGFATQTDGGNGSNDSFQVFNYLPDQYPNEDLSGASIKGELTLEIRRVSILKTMPFIIGSTAELPRRRVVLRSDSYMQPNNGGVFEYGLQITGMASTLRGDSTWFSQNSGMAWSNLSWLVFNRAKNECWKPDGTPNGGNSTGYTPISNSGILYDSDFYAFDRPGGWQASEKPIPPDWARDSGICIFKTDACGRISFPYEIKNIDLKH